MFVARDHVEGGSGRFRALHVEAIYGSAAGFG